MTPDYHAAASTGQIFPAADWEHQSGRILRHRQKWATGLMLQWHFAQGFEYSQQREKSFKGKWQGRIHRSFTFMTKIHQTHLKFMSPAENPSPRIALFVHLWQLFYIMDIYTSQAYMHLSGLRVRRAGKKTWIIWDNWPKFVKPTHSLNFIGTFYREFAVNFRLKMGQKQWFINVWDQPTPPTHNRSISGFVFDGFPYGVKTALPSQDL